jgi:hypothetical protein
MKTFLTTGLACTFWTACHLATLAGDQPIQAYSSGSTGADGPFAPRIINTLDGPELQGVPPGTRLFRGRQEGKPRDWIFVPLPADGIFQFTSFELPAGFEMAFDTRGTSNPGVTILAQQDIVLGGWISVDPAETLMAANPTLLAATMDPSVHSRFYSAVAGPGGFPGGTGFRQMGTGPWPGVGRGLSAGMTYGFPEHRSLPLTLPLIGGSGSASDKDKPDSLGLVGAGGGGTLVLASSGVVRFTGGGLHIMGGSAFRYYNDASEHRVAPQLLERYAGSGSAAVFANETKGDLKLDSNGDLHRRVLIAAFDQEFFNPTRVNITPPWPVGVTGLDMPIAPSAGFVELDNKNITTNVGARVIVPTNGNYPLTIETRNLPAGVVFRTTIHRLAPNGDRLAITHVDFPATVSISPGVCRARASIPVETGSQFVTAIATSKLQTVQCPTIQGEALDTMVVEVDLQGRQNILFRTSTGRDVPYAEAMEAARKQGKLGFLSAMLDRTQA